MTSIEIQINFKINVIDYEKKIEEETNVIQEKDEERFGKHVVESSLDNKEIDTVSILLD